MHTITCSAAKKNCKFQLWGDSFAKMLIANMIVWGGLHIGVDFSCFSILIQLFVSDKKKKNVNCKYDSLHLFGNSALTMVLGGEFLWIMSGLLTQR